MRVQGCGGGGRDEESSINLKDNQPMGCREAALALVTTILGSAPSLFSLPGLPRFGAYITRGRQPELITGGLASRTERPKLDRRPVLFSLFQLLPLFLLSSSTSPQTHVFPRTPLGYTAPQPPAQKKDLWFCLCLHPHKKCCPPVPGTPNKSTGPWSM